MALAPLNILLVDDRPENLLALEHVVAQADRRIFTASSGNEALRLLLKQEFAVVLLDVEMPGMDGYETAELIRSQDRTRAVPIIFVTAGERTDERIFRGYDVGAVDFLYKPINAHILRSKVEVFADLHRRTEELAQANAALERTTVALEDKIADLEFVNRTLSHDLRAPLRSIHSFSQILAESLDGMLDAENEEHLGRIVRACGRMGLILDDLFGLLRVSAASARFTDVSTSEVLEGVVESLRSDIDQAGAVVTHDPLPPLRASPTLLAQIFQNLIANALKFRGGRSPQIHIAAERVADTWQVCVSDNGVGIDPSERDRVFGLFERLGGDTSGGAGVGLSLCKRAIEKHGGRIWVESTPGAGSAFYFSIPV